ncbi:hypothetical protein NL676_039105 [Syzygium grande]|nr:hypothetical protein NL676_039105 [Syzygium grande]
MLLSSKLTNGKNFNWIVISPQVIFCGYSIPHPSEARVNVRVQTTDEPAREVLKDACQDLMLMCQHIRGTFDKAVNDIRTENPPDNHPSQDIDSD